MRWFISCGQDNKDGYYDDKHVWTICWDRKAIGWTNDSCCEGYGLPKEIAQYIVNVLNSEEPVPEGLRKKYRSTTWGFDTII